MNECAARHQCYFIDACRVGTELLERNAGFAGDPVVQWTGAAANPNGKLCLGPIFYSTLAESAAYARVGKLSIFTDALLQSLSGAGSGDEWGPWEVKTARLHQALDFLMREASQALKMPQAQIPTSDSFAELTLNTLVNPRVPVLVRVHPPEAHALAALRCESVANKSVAKREKRRPSAEPWRLSVTTGKYCFFADFKTKKYKVNPLIDEIVRPPFWGKPLKVQP
jgi:hypothetical protein